MVGEPWRLSLEQIADLTDFQIVTVYTTKEDEPVSVPGATDRPPTREEERAMLFGFGQVVKMSQEDLEAVWRAKYPEG